VQTAQSAQITHSEPRLTMASPKARRLANEHNLNLQTIQGSGPLGAILSSDVLATGHATPSQLPQTLPMSTVWHIMAERTTQSWTSVPHFSLIREVDASALIALGETVRQRFPVKITYSDLLTRIVAKVLPDHPRLNASWQDGVIRTNQHINIGLAVVTEQGLVVPVIQQASTLDLPAIARQRHVLVEAARSGKLRPEHIQGGTFTISNLGMYGVDAFNAIINSPQSAILAVGRIADRVVPVNGRPAVRPMVVLTLSCDHRVIDGAHGALFLHELAVRIENPSWLL
jgi:pyruvate dehydrogenase E2 component (dihydrolipoamide acetyltransferase)